MAKSELSKGWEWKHLGSAAGSTGPFTDGDWILSRNMSPNGEVRLIQLADIGSGKFLDSSSKLITREKCNELNCTLLQPGDILISRMPHPIGRACILPKLQQDAITAVDVTILRVDSEIADARFVMYLCNSPFVRKQVELLARGSTRKRITRKDLEQIKIPMPPLEEQRRIVARIEELLSRIEKAKRLQSEIGKEIDQLTQSILITAFRGEL